MKAHSKLDFKSSRSKLDILPSSHRVNSAQLPDFHRSPMHLTGGSNGSMLDFASPRTSSKTSEMKSQPRSSHSERSCEDDKASSDLVLQARLGTFGFNMPSHVQNTEKAKIVEEDSAGRPARTEASSAPHQAPHDMSPKLSMGKIACKNMETVPGCRLPEPALNNLNAMVSKKPAFSHPALKLSATSSTKMLASDFTYLSSLLGPFGYESLEKPPTASIKMLESDPAYLSSLLAPFGYE